jgi:hypothetical protein
VIRDRPTWFNSLNINRNLLDNGRDRLLVAIPLKRDVDEFLRIFSDVNYICAVTTASNRFWVYDFENNEPPRSRKTIAKRWKSFFFHE